ncbi:hypothetical protein K2173_001563 [Erythroxylum novogranatense]|uniref:Uncharacterized protein n=1 Tax=Erythroxylum novogranatense TaxID=1862640 RepID=A0AAV8T448_9ROSI|nr:hypothetical protein K2173_001563 [Erythroxylum novogranatense]
MDPNKKQMAFELFEAHAHLYKHMFKYMNSMCLWGAVQLGIPDAVHNHGKAITIPELVSALNINPAKTNCLYRIMRMLVHSGFFATVIGEEDGEESYSLTQSSRLLVKANPNCLSLFVKSLLTPEFLAPWYLLADWFHGNESTAFEKAHGMPFWELNDKNTEFNQLFNQAMACDSRMMNLVIRECKPIIEGVDSFVDVGGGTGSLARIISEAHPHMKCTVLELPQVVANLKSSENLNFVAGDMFQHIPPAAVIILKLILHNWSDDECVKILKKCREAVSIKGEGGKVIIIDLVIDEKNDEHELTETKLLFDLLMMVVVTGRERSEKEWKRLFMKAGFTRYKIRPLLGLRSLIEVYP